MLWMTPTVIALPWIAMDAAGPPSTPGHVALAAEQKRNDMKEERKKSERKKKERKKKKRTGGIVYHSASWVNLLLVSDLQGL